jgi:hypothetical protein
LNSAFKREWLVKLIYVVLECLSKLLLNVVSPVVLLVEVLILDLNFLFDTGVDELLIKDHNTTFAPCLQCYVSLATRLGFLLDVFLGFMLHIIHFDLLGELKDYWLINGLSIVAKRGLKFFVFQIISLIRLL